MLTFVSGKIKYHISSTELCLIFEVKYSRALEITSLINAAMDEFAISESAARRNMFLAQVSHESKFQPIAEKFNYRAERLVATWPKRFKSIKFAQEYAHKPEKTANFVYGSRGGNEGEGFRYRGRGGLQITHKKTYREASKDLGFGSKLVTNPDLLLNDNLAWRASAWYWKSRKLNELIDKNPGNVKMITKVINGGDTGLDDRIEQYSRIMRYMPDNGGELRADRNNIC